MVTVAQEEKVTLRSFAEYGPRNAPVKNPDLRGWKTPIGHFVCAGCAARILGRGCHLPNGSEPVWMDYTGPLHECCVC